MTPADASPSRNTRPPADRTPATASPRLQSVLSRALIWSVAISAVVTLSGIGLHLAHHVADRVALGTFESQPEAMRSLTQIFTGALRLEARPVMQLGLALLIATPIVRVFFALIVFAVQRDRLYAVISGLVLLLLLAGFL